MKQLALWWVVWLGAGFASAQAPAVLPPDATTPACTQDSVLYIDERPVGRSPSANFVFSVRPSVDTPFSSGRLIHKIGGEYRPAYIAPTHPFLRGENYKMQAMKEGVSGHLKYAFQFHPGSDKDRLYGSAYQGIGMSRYTFFNADELGDPTAVYLLQGARIARIGSRLSLNYEWNFGLSFGWNPYRATTNEFNKVIGSPVNAYLNTNFYLNWMFSRRFDLTAGLAFSHFSNGSTRLPNAGLNTIGAVFGLVYNMNREIDRYRLLPPLPGPAFERHMSYEAVLFGAWRRRGVQVGDSYLAAPGRYAVFGGSLAAMYNLGYKIRVGASLDLARDGSANLYHCDDYIVGTTPAFLVPSFGRQVSMGLSAKVDYVMPYFTISLGFGGNVLHGGGNLEMFYQTLALKIDLARNTFLHIGYSLRDFHSPNFLMLGFGYRFNNRTQTYRP